MLLIVAMALTNKSKLLSAHVNFIIVIVVDGSSDRIAAVVDCSIFEEGATANFCKVDTEYDIARDSLMVGFIVPLVVEQEL